MPSRAAAALVILGAVGVLAWRLFELSGIDPRDDHAHYSLWVRDFLHAPHLLPRADAQGSLREALLSDPSSAAHQLLRRIYNQPVRVFQISTFATHYAAVSVRGDDFRDFVQVGILGSVIAVLLLTASVWSLGALDATADPRIYPWTALLTAAFSFSCFYLHAFSAQGWHNVALSWCFAHLLASLQVVAQITRRGAASRTAWLLCLFTLGLALYSYYVLPWIVFPAVFLQLAVAWPASRRALLVYAGASAVLLLPAIAVYLGVWQQATNELALSRFTTTSLADRILAWATETAAIVSARRPGGLAASVSSMLARRGVVFPFVFVLTHFALSHGQPDHRNATVWHRTVVYLLPMLTGRSRLPRRPGDARA